MAARMPHAEHVRLAGTGHLVHAADPQRYLRLVERLL
jgi:pimeloyl-ACP methyl ester carboxylesterase